MGQSVFVKEFAFSLSQNYVKQSFKVCQRIGLQYSKNFRWAEGEKNLWVIEM